MYVGWEWSISADNYCVICVLWSDSLNKHLIIIIIFRIIATIISDGIMSVAHHRTCYSIWWSLRFLACPFKNIRKNNVFGFGIMKITMESSIVLYAILIEAWKFLSMNQNFKEAEHIFMNCPTKFGKIMFLVLIFYAQKETRVFCSVKIFQQAVLYKKTKKSISPH